MENTPLTSDELERLANEAQGFFGAPSSAHLQEKMSALNPDDATQAALITQLRKAHLKLTAEPENTNPECEEARLLARREVRKLLGFPDTKDQQEGEWAQLHPGV